ncbi:alpha/beta-hydrolase [Polyplosphaeria fusca]|uniref:Alpha/beta-hydrolase n=1 Tax=Polyplosphaeria fusca TaxID=682080 RepID=A0A9P4R2R0_9PLEO|nr:alpha/beta-hydrolase [Polyplosphaeria fusca]
MSTYENAKTLFVSSPSDPSTKYAYRFIGPLSASPKTSIPLLYLPHFRCTIDTIDPQLINALASTRPVLLTDYAGVGKSSGTVASSAAATADQIFDFLALLGVPEVDVLGFSIGGRVAQMLGLNKSRIPHLIIAGSTASPTQNSGIVPPSEARAAMIPKLAAAPQLPISAFETLFFAPDASGRAACAAWWKRMEQGRSERTSGEPSTTWVDVGYASWDDAKAIQAQAQTLAEFDSVDGVEGSWDRLGELEMPVLVANGSDDFMVPTVNSFLTAQQIKRAKLITYPNSGHGFLYQYADEFAADVERFLTAKY